MNDRGSTRLSPKKASLSPSDASDRFVERRTASGEQHLAAEANALARLHEASTRLWQIRDLREGLDEIISATIELMGADLGNVQLLESGTLRIAGQRGFAQEFLEFFREVSAENNSACGRALRSGGRIVIEDVETDELYEPFREVARSAGYRSVQSTPLVGGDGVQLGVISTHFKKPHRPDEEDLRLLDLYVRQASDFIERCKSEERQRQILSLMQAAVYSCDASGTITYFNEQAVKLWGREPKIGDTDERFCGSEQMILPDGTPLAHEDCPMAVALREGESFRNTEVNIRRPDDSVITVLVNIDPTRNERGEITGAINTFHDVSVIKEAEKALVESEAARRFAMEAAGAGSWTWDAGTGVVTWSRQTYELFGMDPRKPLRFESWRNSLHPDDRDRAEAAVLQSMELGHDLEVEYRVTHSTRGERWLTSLGRVIDPYHRPGYMTGITMDITERKQAEEVLRRSRNTFLSLIENAPLGVFLVDSEFRLTQISRGCEKVFAGIDPLIGRGFDEVLRIVWPEPFASQALDIFRDTLRAGEPYHSPDTTEHRGNIRAVESYDWQIERITMPDGSFGVVCYFYETTERVQAEQDASFLGDLAERIRLADDAEHLIAEVTGALGEFLSLNRCYLIEIDEADNRATVVADYHSGVSSLVGEYKLSDYPAYVVSDANQGRLSVVPDSKTDPRTADFYETSYEPLELRAHVSVPLLRNGRWVALLAGVCSEPREWQPREISLLETVAERTWNAIEKLRADRELRESEERFARFMQYFPGLAWIKDIDGRYVFANDAAAHAFGATFEDIYGKRDDELFPKDTAERFRENDKRALETGECILEEERLLQDDGIAHSSLVNKFPIPGPDGRPTLVGGMAIDITERKRAEEALRDQKRLYQSVTDNAAVALFIMDERQQCSFMNPAAEQLTGYTLAETRGRPLHDLVHHTRPDCSNYPLSECPIDQAFPENDQLQGEEVFVHKDGHFYPVAFTASPLRDESGKAVGTIIEVQDITERKDAEDALRESERELSDFFDNAAVGLHWVGPDGMIIRVNQAELDLLGYTKDEYLGRHIADFHADQPVIEDILARLTRGETLHEYPARLLHKDGSIRDVLINSSVMFKDGQFVHTRCFTTDVTARRSAELALRASEQHAKGALEFAQATLRTSPIPLIVLDGDLQVMTANDAFYDTFQVDPDETVGVFIYDLDNGQWDIPRLRELLENILPQQSVFNGFEVTHEFESIGTRTMMLNARRLDRDPEMPDRIVLVIEDVTERLAADKAVRDREMLQRLVTAQEDERKRLALDLHDDLGQELTALRLALDGIGKRLEPGSELRSKFDLLESIALDIDERVDRMAWEFRPAVLDQFGLIPAIERFVERWQIHAGVACELVVRSNPDRRYGQEIETHLYRIIQETFNNIAKHAQANNVSVVIDERRGRLTFIIEDDGKGFDQHLGRAGNGMGLSGMSERAALIDGTLEVESTPDQGTTIYVSVPVAEATRAAR